jgi:hypothetical protein
MKAPAFCESFVSRKISNRQRGKVHGDRMNSVRRMVGTILFSLPLFVFSAGDSAQLPPSKGAPQVGQKAPDFTLPDTSNTPVKLSELLADPAAAAKRPAKSAPALLLVFYRGYW